MPKLSVRDLDVAGKRVLVRVDFNVPLKEKDSRWQITDDTRIEESLPTIKLLRERGAKTILMSHLGRPTGKPAEKYSLRPVGMRLHELIDHPVLFSHNITGEVPEKIIAHMHDGDVALLENLRFYPGEESNDPQFAKALAGMGEVYVNDAFGSAHRAHASTEGITHHIPKSAMGLLMEKELKFLKDELAQPEHPFVVILGGAKVSDKIGVIKALMEKADVFLIGGAMANTFFKTQGIAVGASRVEEDKLDLARQILDLAKEKRVKFVLPVDSVITQELKAGAATQTTATHADTPGIPDGWLAVDIGPETVKIFREDIDSAKTILWNGPVGVFEIEEFSHGTRALAQALAESQAKTIIGGGDSVTAIKKAGLAEKMTFISTGGGASLELIEGRELPGVAALTEV